MENVVTRRQPAPHGGLRVLIVHAGNLYGGVETALLATVDHAPSDLELHVGLCFHGEIGNRLQHRGVPVHWLKAARMRDPISVVRARGALRRLLRSERFDACVSTSPWVQAIFGSVIKDAGVPLVAWVHNPPDQQHPIDWAARRVRPDLLIANSRFTQGEVRAAYPSVPVRVIYCPVALPDVDRSEAERRRVRRELATQPDDVVVIMVSRIDGWKGHSVLIEALSLMPTAAPWRCWIVGGPQRAQEERRLERLRHEAREHGVEQRVVFAGQRADVASLLAASDLMCQPNTDPEPFGVTFVEALNAGVPVVTSACGGAMEIVDDTCGALVPPGDVLGVSQMLSALIDDRARRVTLGLSGRRKVRELCDPSQRVAELGAAIRDVVAGSAQLTPTVACHGIETP